MLETEKSITTMVDVAGEFVPAADQFPRSAFSVVEYDELTEVRISTIWNYMASVVGHRSGVKLPEFTPEYVKIVDYADPIEKRFDTSGATISPVSGAVFIRQHIVPDLPRLVHAVAHELNHLASCRHLVQDHGRWSHVRFGWRSDTSGVALNEAITEIATLEDLSLAKDKLASLLGRSFIPDIEPSYKRERKMYRNVLNAVVLAWNHPEFRLATPNRRTKANLEAVRSALDWKASITHDQVHQLFVACAHDHIPLETVEILLNGLLGSQAYQALLKANYDDPESVIEIWNRIRSVLLQPACQKRDLEILFQNQEISVNAASIPEGVVTMPIEVDQRILSLTDIFDRYAALLAKPIGHQYLTSSTMRAVQELHLIMDRKQAILYPFEAGIIHKVGDNPTLNFAFQLLQEALGVAALPHQEYQPRATFAPKLKSKYMFYKTNQQGIELVEWQYKDNSYFFFTTRGV